VELLSPEVARPQAAAVVPQEVVQQVMVVLQVQVVAQPLEVVLQVQVVAQPLEVVLQVQVVSRVRVRQQQGLRLRPQRQVLHLLHHPTQRQPRLHRLILLPVQD
jgi:hypothetical protein